jgi:hypothetical protein
MINDGMFGFIGVVTGAGGTADEAVIAPIEAPTPTPDPTELAIEITEAVRSGAGYALNSLDGVQAFGSTRTGGGAAMVPGAALEGGCC